MRTSNRMMTNKQKKELRRQQVAAIRKRTGWRPSKDTVCYMRNTVTAFNKQTPKVDSD